MTSYRSSPLEGKLVIDSYICPQCGESIEKAIWSKVWSHYTGYRGDIHNCQPNKLYQNCSIENVEHQHIECYGCKLNWIRLI